MSFFVRKDIGRIYVLRMELPDGHIVHKIGMTKSDSKGLDRGVLGIVNVDMAQRVWRSAHAAQHVDRGVGQGGVQHQDPDEGDTRRRTDWLRDVLLRGWF